MSRLILEGLDLRGQTIDNPGPYLYVGGCLLGEKDGRLTQFVGDCTAADYINCDGPADWSRADTYAGYWRGCNLEGSAFPARIGYLHHEPVAEILRQGTANATGVEQAILTDLPDWVKSDCVAHSWDSGWEGHASNVLGATTERFASALRLAVAGYPSLEHRVEELGRALRSGPVSFAPLPLARWVEFPDGARVWLDCEDLPSLPREQDRYEFGLWIAAKADEQRPGSHYAFVKTIVPPVVMPSDIWRKYRSEGF